MAYSISVYHVDMRKNNFVLSVTWSYICETGLWTVSAENIYFHHDWKYPNAKENFRNFLLQVSDSYINYSVKN
jgi:hypothetical protein